MSYDEEREKRSTDWVRGPLLTLSGTALIGFLSWQMMTLQSLTRSVEVIANQVREDSRRITVIEDRLYNDYIRRGESHGR